MLPLDDAFKMIEDKINPLEDTEDCDIKSALGRTAASDIFAPYALPPFTNTGVDGYAFCHQENKNILKLVAASFAGEPFSGTLKEGEAARIATGAVLPHGADTVVMQEVCVVESGTLTIKDLPPKGSNLRHAGGDIHIGDIAVRKGQLLRAQDIALLLALGISSIKVVRPLRIAIISTGLELLQNSGHQELGKIIDTNSLMLSQMLTKAGYTVHQLSALPDAYEATSEALKDAASKYDVVISTGGVSVGDRDFIRDVLHDEGDILFWKIAIRPGKPVIMGHIGSCLMIGLPGNPVSAFVTCLLIVRASLNALSGRPTTLPDGFKVTLGEDISKPETLRAFPRAIYMNGTAMPYSDQASNLYTSLTNADGLLDLPTGKSTFKKGEEVIFRPFSLLL